MILGDVELYNIHELVSGSLRDLLSREALEMVVAQAIERGEPLDIEVADGRWMSRIPDGLRRSLNPRVQINGLATPGCEARFALQSDDASIVLAGASRPSIVEV